MKRNRKSQDEPTPGPQDSMERGEEKQVFRWVWTYFRLSITLGPALPYASWRLWRPRKKTYYFYPHEANAYSHPAKPKLRPVGLRILLSLSHHVLTRRPFLCSAKACYSAADSPRKRRAQRHHGAMDCKIWKTVWPAFLWSPLIFAHNIRALPRGHGSGDQIWCCDTGHAFWYRYYLQTWCTLWPFCNSLRRQEAEGITRIYGVLGPGSICAWIEDRRLWRCIILLHCIIAFID